MAVYVVDDGSTDGTAEAISEHFPSVRLLQGDGNLYWNGAMRLAFAEALRQDFDYYLWLNDDTTLFPDSLPRMLRAAAKYGDRAIIVGSARDPDTGGLSYGGVRRMHRWRPFEFTWIAPRDGDVAVHTMNGNCVLIPRAIAQKVGNLDPAFTHGMGDFDYGLRASALRLPVIAVRGFVGECKRNDLQGGWLDASLPLSVRMRKALGPKGLPPRELAVFARRHAGPFWPIYWALAYRHLLLPQRQFERSL
jgi:GT2 family glycosyltransferase